jgi:hypothetical protein
MLGDVGLDSSGCRLPVGDHGVRCQGPLLGYLDVKEEEDDDEEEEEEEEGTS